MLLIVYAMIGIIILLPVLPLMVGLRVGYIGRRWNMEGQRSLTLLTLTPYAICEVVLLLSGALGTGWNDSRVGGPGLGFMMGGILTVFFSLFLGFGLGAHSCPSPQRVLGLGLLGLGIFSAVYIGLLTIFSEWVPVGSAWFLFTNMSTIGLLFAGTRVMLFPRVVSISVLILASLWSLIIFFCLYWT